MFRREGTGLGVIVGAGNGSRCTDTCCNLGCSCCRAVVGAWSGISSNINCCDCRCCNGRPNHMYGKVRRNSHSASEALADSYTCFFYATKCRGVYSALKTIVQALVVFGIFVLLIVAIHWLFPDTTRLIQDLADWADDYGPYGVVLFSLIAGLLMLIPGVPGSLLCFTCGAVFPFWSGLAVAVAGHHLGAIWAFLLSRCCLYTHFTSLLKSRPTLRAMSKAAELEQWKVTFLSRFVFMPVQLKNYVFGVLPVSFKCFFFMALIGDFQSAIFGVYLGSLSKNMIDSTVNANAEIEVINLDQKQQSQSLDGTQKVLWVVSVVLAITMTTVASIVARQAYNKVIRGLEREAGEEFEEVHILEGDTDMAIDDQRSRSPESTGATSRSRLFSPNARSIELVP